MAAVAGAGQRVLVQRRGAAAATMDLPPHSLLAQRPPAAAAAGMVVPPAVWVGCIVGLAVVGCAPAYWTYGVHFFLPLGLKVMHHSSEEWQGTLLPRKTLLFIGGHHRGGTTLLWELLAEHPDIGGFGTTFETGSDYSEGAFLQTGMPTFGVGSESLTHAGNFPAGLGVYALAPKRHVSWTELTRADKVTAARQQRLLNEWGYFWREAGQWETPFWLEKTPTNAVVSRYLQALINLGIEREPRPSDAAGPDAVAVAAAATLPWSTPRTSRARFLFMQRHPLANALAHQAFMGTPRSLPDLLANWVAVAEYMAADIPYLEHAMLIKLEDLVAAPDAQLDTIWEFIGVHPPSSPGAVVVRGDVNRKYELRYCVALNDPKDGATKVAAHRVLRRRFGEAVRRAGYDLDEWPCIAEAERRIAAGSSSVPPG
jgi:hypothetical protein